MLTNSSYETDKSWNLLAHRKEKTVSTGTYLLRAPGLSPINGEHEDTQLVYIDRTTGKELLLYDASKSAMGQSLAKTAFIVVLLIAIPVSMIARSKHNKMN